MTDAARTLLGLLEAQGVVVYAVRDRLSFEGPAGVVTGEVRSDLSALREEILDVLRQPVQRRPLSDAELQLWLLGRRQRGISYVLSGAFKLSGLFDPVKFQLAIDDVVSLHASLRACVVERDGIPQLESKPDVVLQTRVVIASEPTLSATLAELDSDDINLDYAPLYRVDVVALQPEEHVVLVRAHHIVSDDVSVRVFCEQVLERYEELSGAGPRRDLPGSGLVPIAPSWRCDPARKRLALERQEAMLPAMRMELPPPVGDEEPVSHGGVADIVVDSVRLANWERVRREVGVSSSALAISIFALAVRAAGGPDDQLIGGSQMGRGPRESSSIGYYARLTIARVQCSANPTFGDHVRAVAADLIAATAAAEAGIPVHEIVDNRAQSVHGGCVLFAVAYASLEPPSTRTLIVSPVPMATKDERHDLRLEIRLGTEIRLSLAWRSKVVSKPFVTMVWKALSDMTDSIPAPETSTSRIEVALAKVLSEIVDVPAPPASDLALKVPSAAIPISEIAKRRRARRV